MSNTQKWDDLTEDYQRVILTPITSEGDQRFTQYAMDWGTTIGTLKAAWKFFGEQPKFTGTGQVVLKDLGGTNAQFFTLQAKAISFVDAPLSGDNIIVHCARGGMRSSSIAWWLKN